MNFHDQTLNCFSLDHMIYRPNRIKDLKTMHMFFCIGPLLMILLFHFFIKPMSFSGFLESLHLFSMIGLGLAAVNVLIGTYFFKKKIDDLGTDINSENMEDYTAAYVIKWAFIEGAVLVNTLFYFFLDADPLNLMVAMLLLIVLYLSRPIIKMV